MKRHIRVRAQGPKGYLAVVMIVLITIVGLANFAAQFVVPTYHADPWITYIFMGTAATIGGATGVTIGKGPKDNDDEDRGGPQ